MANTMRTSLIARPAVYPEINAEEFRDFARLMRRDPLFPITYESWIVRVQHEVGNQFKVGSIIDPRKVHADEFARWCRTFGYEPSLTALWRFAVWKANGHGA
jgi:hypothetical protein